MNKIKTSAVFFLLICFPIASALLAGHTRHSTVAQTPEASRQVSNLLDHPFESSAPMGSPKNPAVILPAASAALLGDLPAARKIGDKLLVPIAELQKIANQPLVGSLLAPVTSQLTPAKSFDGFSAVDGTASGPGLYSILNGPNAAARKVSGEDFAKTRALVRNGDLIFGSHVVNAMTWGRYNHVGIVSDAERGKILEATANGPSDQPGVVESDWSTYTTYGHIGVARVRGASPEQLANVIRWIEGRKGRPYRWPIVMGLDNTDESRFYCSQLVWRAFKQVMNIDLDADQGALIFPDDIYNSKTLVDVIVP
ncbi:MAG TPA: YiiX/YebB-like N1pC/P60 family cysteine hydrolase [Pyrinomonadaceae bacterium]|nr:YiiX/YebB-like N1pC/P60 family cysteine hydrolase [Pyrinomonadaceae bacterium]